MAQLLGKRQSKNRLLTAILALIVFYALWGFVYRTTIYGSKSMQYVHLVLVFILSLYYVGSKGIGRFTNTSIAWSPYLAYSLLYLTFTLLFQSSNFILFVEFSICLLMILIATRTPLHNYVSVKFIFWSGVFAIIGIGVQVFMPGFYNSSIAGIFVSEESVLRWAENEYGLSGFTSQIAITARILIYGEIVLLYMKADLLPKRLQSNFCLYSIVVLFVFCVLLTGKRLPFLVAASLPFIVPFLAERNFAKRHVKLLFVILLVIIVGEIFVSNIDYFLQTSMFRRFAETYEGLQGGEDISSGRTELYVEAWKAFQDYPIFGIGLGQFGSYAGVEHYVHNTYLQVLCEQGVFGITFFVFGIFLSIKNTVRLLKTEKMINNLLLLKVSLGIQIFYILYCITGNELSGAGLIMYFLAIAILVSVERLSVRYSR